MQSDDFQAVVANDVAYRFGFGNGEISGVFLEGEGSDFETFITGCGGACAGFAQTPTLVGFVTDGEFHKGEFKRSFAY